MAPAGQQDRALSPDSARCETKTEESASAGFKVCEIIASEPESKTYFPLLTHVWSHEVPGFVSDVPLKFQGS